MCQILQDGEEKGRTGEKIGEKKSKTRIIQSVSPALCSHSLFFSNFSPVFYFHQNRPGASHTNLCRDLIVLCPWLHQHLTVLLTPTTARDLTCPVYFTQFPWAQGISGIPTPQSDSSSAKQCALLRWALSYLQMMISHTNVSN